MAKQKIISNEELLKEIKSLHKEIEELKKPQLIQYIPQPYPVIQHVCPPCYLQHYPQYVQQSPFISSSPFYIISQETSQLIYNQQNSIGGTLIG